MKKLSAQSRVHMQLTRAGGQLVPPTTKQLTKLTVTQSDILVPWSFSGHDIHSRAVRVEGQRVMGLLLPWRRSVSPLCARSSHLRASLKVNCKLQLQSCTGLTIHFWLWWAWMPVIIIISVEWKRHVRTWRMPNLIRLFQTYTACTQTGVPWGLQAKQERRTAVKQRGLELLLSSSKLITDLKVWYLCFKVAPKRAADELQLESLQIRSNLQCWFVPFPATKLFPDLCMAKLVMAD